MKIQLWTDGSGTTSGPIGWGWVLLAFDGETGELLSERVGGGAGHEGTNNRAELMAVVDGLRTITKPSIVEVVTDSEYVANAFNKGYIVKWMDNGWRLLSSGKPVKNFDVWQLLVEQAERHVVTFTHVDGHAGHDHNERCDRIAGACRRAVKDELAGLLLTGGKRKAEPRKTKSKST